MTEGTPATGEVARRDKVGGATIDEGAQTALRHRMGDQTFITNNVPYIDGLEHGSSGQAPAGMVAVTVENVRGQFA